MQETKGSAFNPTGGRNCTGFWPQRFCALSWIISVLVFISLVETPSAKAQQFIDCAGTGKPLIKVPEIAIPKAERDKGIHTLRGIMYTNDQQRNLWPPKGGSPCSPQYMRYFRGRPAGAPADWWEKETAQYTTGGFPEPIPGPTLRARVGDWVQLIFLNQINTKDFGNSIDRGEKGLGCDEVVGSTPPQNTPDWQSNSTYAYGSVIKPASNNAGGYYFFSAPATPGAPSGTTSTTRPNFPQTQGQRITDGGVIWTNAGLNPPIYPGSDVMPDCFHGSSTTNIHFHGTHTTPSTTGDNVLLQIRPSLRTYPPEPNGKLVVTEESVLKPFSDFFAQCERNGPPTSWNQMPPAIREQQMGPWPGYPQGWLGAYDQTAAYKPMPLRPSNERIIKEGGWPQFYIGAFPYCFHLPKYREVLKPQNKPALMGQVPGTHWYHAHKHGSTDINVSNSMTGALIIEGEYDDVLEAYYKTGAGRQGDLKQQVMVFQQLTTVPRILSSQGGGGAVISVNGRQQPVVTMAPNEVQLWRLVNTDSRSMVTLCQFVPEQTGQPVPQWVQTAQDGVQLAPSNYDPATTNTVMNMASGNRVDLLVQAPTQTGTYQLQMLSGVAPSTKSQCGSKTTVLLTVQVQGTAVGKANNFIPQASFPQLPPFLENITGPIYVHRELVFNSVPNVAVPASANSNPNPAQPPFPGAAVGRTANSHFINNKQFEDHTVDQKMLLDTVEEWKVLNLTNGTNGPGAIWHPFHIHINPFQVTEVFDPNSASETCVDPTKPTTWKPCSRPAGYPPKNFVWWDVFAIPAGKVFPLQSSVCTQLNNCPADIRPYTTCTTGSNPACSVTVPGYFIMRTRFADFTGQYVLHCHILAHEDRGMMELIEVVPNTSIYGHD